jgi:hypothetical protein
MRQSEIETPDLSGWTQTDTGMWRQQHGALLEIMNEDDDRWHGYVDGVAVGEGPDLPLIIDLVMAAAPTRAHGTWHDAKI